MEFAGASGDAKSRHFRCQFQTGSSPGPGFDLACARNSLPYSTIQVYMHCTAAPAGHLPTKTKNCPACHIDAYYSCISGRMYLPALPVVRCTNPCSADYAAWRGRSAAVQSAVRPKTACTAMCIAAVCLKSASTLRALQRCTRSTKYFRHESMCACSLHIFLYSLQPPTPGSIPTSVCSGLPWPYPVVYLST